MTWIQLRCLAWAGWDTPPLSISELASLIGIHPARLYRHLSQLQEISALVCRSTGYGKLILSFPEAPTVKTENRAVAPILTEATILNSQNRELPDPPSYFPSQILGYLSFQEDQEGFSDFEVSKDFEDERVERVRDFTDFQNCEIDLHAKIRT